MFINSSGQLFGRYNLIDFCSLVFGVLLIIGVLVVQSGWYRTSGQMVKGEADIRYSILMKNVKTLQPDLFKPGKKLAITIRNQPRGEVKIEDVKRSARQMAVPSGQGYKLVDDAVDPYGYDYLVTLSDHALVTADGYVTEGVKVKIGSHIEVEGFDYRLPGVIVAIEEAQ